MNQATTVPRANSLISAVVCLKAEIAVQLGERMLVRSGRSCFFRCLLLPAADFLNPDDQSRSRIYLLQATMRRLIEAT